MAYDVEGALARIRSSRGFLIHFFTKTADDRLNWRPAVESGGDATTILEIMRHIVASESSMLPVALKEGGDHEPSADWASSAKFASAGPAAGATTKEEIVAKLNEAAAVLDAAILEVPQERWGEEYDAGWMKAPRFDFLGLVALHYDYHNGQIAYIQRLYGDLEF